jgi:hypothetical protein
MLGLRADLAAKLTLAQRLPDSPAAPRPADQFGRHAFDERFDVALARAELDATARGPRHHRNRLAGRRELS